jgi:hypothetical protein
MPASALDKQGGARHRRRLLSEPRALLGGGLLGGSKGAQAPAPAAGAGGATDEMYMVVGFEVMACSIARTAGQKPKDVSCIDALEGRPAPAQEISKGMGRAGKTLRSPRTRTCSSPLAEHVLHRGCAGCSASSCGLASAPMHSSRSLAE